MMQRFHLQKGDCDKYPNSQCHAYVEPDPVGQYVLYHDVVVLLTKAHQCATLRDDGTCDGCFISEALEAQT